MSGGLVFQYDDGVVHGDKGRLSVHGLPLRRLCQEISTFFLLIQTPEHQEVSSLLNLQRGSVIYYPLSQSK